MNCCNEYGNCRQGRDCPVRVAKVGQRMHGPEILPTAAWRWQVGVAARYALGLIALLLYAALLSAVLA